MARKTKKQKEAESGEGVYRYETYASEFWDWDSYRIPDAPVLISPSGYTNKEGQGLPTRKLGETMGHRCPKCPGTLAWGNGGPFIWSMYMLWCPSCHGAWHANHKYIWGLAQSVLKDQGIEVEDTRQEEEESEDEVENPLDDANSAESVPVDIPPSGEPEKKQRKRRSKKSD